MEWRPQASKLVQDAAERPDIAFLIIRLIPPDLRASVVRGASLRIGKSTAINLGDIEIPQLVLIAMDKNIGTFEIPMQDAPSMQMVKRAQYIGGNLPDTNLANPTIIFLDASNIVMQVSPIYLSSKACTCKLHDNAQHMHLVIEEGFLIRHDIAALE